MPVVRSPENRRDFASFEEKNSRSFLKFKPFSPSEGLNYPLFAHRHDVPLVDPCSGFVSPGADADLRPNAGRAVESLLDYSDVKPHQQIPVTGKRGQTAHRRQTILLEETSQNRRWNSRAVSAASVRARLRGWRTPVEVAPALHDQNHSFALSMDPNLKESSDPSARWREEKARDYIYKSSTLKASEEVPWDNMLPAKIHPPESTLEVLADSVSQHFTNRRYNPEPEISQVVGGIWDRFQTRTFTVPQRPVVFGCVGAVNFEDIDNPDVGFIPLNHVRTSKPRYANTAHLRENAYPFVMHHMLPHLWGMAHHSSHSFPITADFKEVNGISFLHVTDVSCTPNIPGYTGKVHWSATHPANSNLPSTAPSVIAQMHGYTTRHSSSSQYNHRGAFSEMVTPLSPQDSFKKRKRKTITV